MCRCETPPFDPTSALPEEEVIPAHLFDDDVVAPLPQRREQHQTAAEARVRVMMDDSLHLDNCINRPLSPSGDSELDFVHSLRAARVQRIADYMEPKMREYHATDREIKQMRASMTIQAVMLKNRRTFSQYDATDRICITFDIIEKILHRTTKHYLERASREEIKASDTRVRRMEAKGEPDPFSKRLSELTAPLHTDLLILIDGDRSQRYLGDCYANFGGLWPGSRPVPFDLNVANGMAERQ